MVNGSHYQCNSVVCDGEINILSHKSNKKSTKLGKKAHAQIEMGLVKEKSCGGNKDGTYNFFLGEKAEYSK